MKFSDFEATLSPQRMRRYLSACNNNTRKAMTLYRYNLQVSQEMFTIVSCFEVALRNAVNNTLIRNLGADWLRDSSIRGGIFDDPNMVKTRDIIYNAYRKLQLSRSYSHDKLLAEMEFGIWKYMYSPRQYLATGQVLLGIFPQKPRSSRAIQYNQRFFFNALDRVNSLRNRIAHHEPICFPIRQAIIDTSYIESIYNLIHDLFMWMGIDSNSLLYGLDHVQQVCAKINRL